VSAVPSFPLRADDDGRGVSTSYERFLSAVVRAQLAAWLPESRSRLLDISLEDRTRGSVDLSSRIARCGHDVIRAVDVRNVAEVDGIVPTRVPGLALAGSDPLPAVSHVAGDIRALDWFRSASVDGLVAEGSALSSALAIEATLEQAARLVRPGGRLLLSVDSLHFGLARLAEQHRWPELADAGRSDVVLVPTVDGGYSRCFDPDELRLVTTQAGFDVEWVRVRTLIPPDVISYAVTHDPTVLGDLIASELDLSQQRADEPLGMYLALSATRRG
jgi:hypothetical protein